jgi:hypothetical protein
MILKEFEMIIYGIILKLIKASLIKKDPLFILLKKRIKILVLILVKIKFLILKLDKVRVINIFIFINFFIFKLYIKSFLILFMFF